MSTDSQSTEGAVTPVCSSTVSDKDVIVTNSSSFGVIAKNMLKKNPTTKTGWYRPINKVSSAKTYNTHTGNMCALHLFVRKGCRTLLNFTINGPGVDLLLVRSIISFLRSSRRLSAIFSIRPRLLWCGRRKLRFPIGCEC